MNRSMPAFYIGLVSSIIGAVCAFVFWLVFVLIGAVAGGATKIICNTIPFLNLACFVFSFVGSFFCLKRARTGGVIMFASSVISLICFVVLSITIKVVNLTTVLLWLPAILILVASLLSLKVKKS